MNITIEQPAFFATYLAFILTTAGSVYGATIWIGSHLSPESKNSLTLWLGGEYESSWSHHFCNLFDAVFGKKHLSWHCFIRSSLASVIAVLILYVLFSEVLGVTGERALGELSLWKAVLFAAVINIFPDYLSLFETRWLLKRFENIQSFKGPLAVLFADALFTGAIILLSVSVFQIVRGEAVLSPIEIMALFSVFSVFFYSTFLSSAWAWVFCLSTWFMRLFSCSALKNILDVKSRPVAQIALVTSSLIFLTSLS